MLIYLSQLYDSFLDFPTRSWNLFAIQLYVDFFYLKALFVSPKWFAFNKIHLLLLYFGDIVSKRHIETSVDIRLQEDNSANFKPYIFAVKIVVLRNIYTFDVFRFLFVVAEKFRWLIGTLPDE